MKLVVIVRIALALGFLTDAFVGVVCLFFPALVQPLFDIPIKDVVASQLAGPEFIVAALVYAVTFTDPVRLRPLLWVCALDQLFAVLMPVFEVSVGAIPASFKVIAPIPVSAVLLVVLVTGALRDTTRRTPA